MPRSREIAHALGWPCRLVAAVVLACGVAAAAGPAQPIWPEKWREHEREKVSPLTPAEPKLWAEFGGEAAEKAVYNSPVGRFSATAYRFQDSTSALAWYEYLRPEAAVPVRGAATMSTLPGALFAAHQNYVLVFDGWRPQGPELEALYKLLPRMRASGGLPKLMEYLPQKDLRRNSERYILGLHSLELFAPARPSAAVTAICPPKGMDSGVIVKEFRNRFGAIIANGQGSMKGQIFRIAHLGYFDFADLFAVIAGLEVILNANGFPVNYGTGVAAVQEIYESAAVKQPVAV